MARLVKHTGTSPKEIKIGSESRWICTCGLTKNSPFCDGAHKQCGGEEEGKLYRYENGKRAEVKTF